MIISTEHLIQCMFVSHGRPLRECSIKQAVLYGLLRTVCMHPTLFIRSLHWKPAVHSRLAILPSPGFPTPGKPGLGNNVFLAKVGNNGQL